jgi:hypothetical protein
VSALARKYDALLHLMQPGIAADYEAEIVP